VEKVGLHVSVMYETVTVENSMVADVGAEMVTVTVSVTKLLTLESQVDSTSTIVIKVTWVGTTTTVSIVVSTVGTVC